MRRRSRRSARRSTTSRRTSKKKLGELIDGLPANRSAAVFTHSSWAADRSESYERLEFLGDSVLELAIAHTLYERFPGYEEGQLAKLRSHVVSRASCAVLARELGLGERLVAARPGPDHADVSRLAENRNVLAALLEAAIAAVYLEHGYAKVAPAIVAAFESRIDFALTNKIDHKTELQEQSARLGRTLAYELVATDGPPHERTFTVAAVLDGVQAGVGRGGSKKDAEQEAARMTIVSFELTDLDGEGAGGGPASEGSD